MLKATFLAVLAVAGLTLANGPATAAPEKYVLETPHTQILFTVDHLGFSRSTGKFLGYEGALVLDRENPAQSHVDVTIRTDSIDLGDQKWNDHMKNEDFFNVEKFPTMTFKSTSVIPTGENTADVAGDLTILGITRPAVLKVTHNKSGEHPFKAGMYMAGFNATTTIKRSDYGMNYGLPAVGDMVEITISAEAIREPVPAQGE